MRLILVDDHLAFRESLKIALEAEPAHGIEVVGEAATARDTYKLLEREKPDILVSDLLLKDTDGISMLRELKRRRRMLPTLVLTRISHPAFLRDAFKAGARGYALKLDPLVDLIGAMRTVGNGERHVSRGISADVEADTPTSLDALSAREREVFCRLIEGWSTKEIAKELYVTLKTVEAHRCQINRKLGVHSPTQLLSYAASQGLV